MTDEKSERHPADTRRTPDATMSLLNELMTHTMDEGYTEAATRKRDDQSSGNGGGGAMAAAVLAMFGVLVAVAFIETERAAPADAEERSQLIERVDVESARVEQLRESVATLQEDVSTLQGDLASVTGSSNDLNARIQELSMRYGTEPVSGPGMVITVDDASGGDPTGEVLDTDLQALVSGLWAAGAEAVSINDQRITSTTSIRTAGAAINVNTRSLTRPYVIRAIGNPATLPARLAETPGGEAMWELRINAGVRYENEVATEITVPGRSMSRLRYADVPKGSE
ncbi:MAG: DUF881 domain-containing protein [Propionibacteriales bacterium]|nr:DUF881 domain-containing protein [Propionibacteriales bacterium]